MAFTRQDWFDRFAADLAKIIAVIVDVAATAGASTSAPSDGWVVTLRADGASHGELCVEFDRDATEVLVKRITGMAIEPPNEVVVDTLKEICAQAAGSLVLETELVGTKLTVVSVERVTDTTPPTPVLAEIKASDVATLPLRLWGDIAVATGTIPVHVPPALAVVNPKLDVILDIDLPLTVRFGRTEMALRVIMSIGPGSMIDLGRSPDDPVEVLVSNQVVARGEVVIVGGNYGVRITDIMSPADRVRSIGSEFS
jgi:flagellar motor switch protein FliN/FliY